MFEYLPHKGFKWSDPDCFDTERILKMKDDQKKGYIFEVDFKYPEELHDLHSDYPLAPENVFDNKELPKLTTTLYDKKKYILHYSNLRLYLSLGLKLKKIDRVIEFEQKDWLRPYIELKLIFAQKQTMNLKNIITNYPENNKYGIPRINKKVPGKFKDELNGQIMTEFVGLRSKLYTYKIFENKNEIKKAKGVKNL
ncbi:DNA polymerase, palm domain [Cinara cedri]|uniref:DNA polymerase, palm domain n=1 Tax=Cinara cedri TaxID=506608 RepID=A0A5E4NJ45_9HEMI|nr:DNA polymerase, palm domain [Cinara cedri]